MGSRIFQWGPFANFAALVANTTPIDGDVANVTMSGVSTKWYYDGTLAVWRINDTFITTSTVIEANTALAGIQHNDKAYASDTGQTAFWNAIQGSYTYVS